MPYVLSIEDTEGHSFQHGFHLGTDLPIAKTIAEKRFHGRVKAGLPVVTVGLLKDGKLVDCYYGDRWHND